ncbi:MAG TPA: hypothetical protein VHM67_04725 [Gemmatimonadaceae bacterium]|nr:hypothetical protein [Gemmatimonadaceae bacterium]
MQRTFTAVSLVLLATGCAGASGTTTTPAPNTNPVVMIDENGRTFRSTQSGTVASFDAPIDSVWNAVLAAYSAMEMEANTLDRPGRTIGRNRLIIRRTFNGSRLSTFFSCGDDMVSGPNANNGEITANVVSHLEESGSSTSVATMVTANIRLYTGTSGGAIRCGSTGELEERLRKAIAKQLGVSSN